MKIATFTHAGHRQVGLLNADASHIRAFAAGQIDASQGAMALVQMLSTGAACPEPAGPTVALADVKLEAPLPVPRRNIICVGRNYHAHARELRDSVFKNNQPESWPIIFTKVPETVIGPGDTVRLPGAAVSTQIDYEAELTIIIGKGGRNIAAGDAMSHVFGYTIINDVTARDVQLRHAQWYPGGCRALGRARVGPGKGLSLGAKRSNTPWYCEHLQQRISPFQGPTRRAGEICGAIRRCRLVVWSLPHASPTSSLAPQLSPARARPKARQPPRKKLRHLLPNGAVDRDR